MTAPPGVGWIRRESEGPPLVLLHGAGGNAELLRPLVAALDAFDLVAPSFPGRAGSEGPPRERAEAVASWLELLLDHLGGPPPFVLGHSFGGAVAIELALRRPLAGLVLVSSGARLRVHPGILAAAEAATRGGERLSGAAAFRPETDPAIVAAYREAEALTPPEATLADWRGCDAFDRMGDLGAIAAPTLVVAGEDDPMTPPKYQRHLAAALPRATLELVPATGHLLPWERRERLASMVRAWSAGVG